MHTLCHAYHLYLTLEIRLGGVEPRATYRASYGALGVDMHRLLNIVVTHCTQVCVGVVLAMRSAVATLNRKVYSHRV